MQNIRRPTSLVTGLMLFILGVILSGSNVSHSAPPATDVKVINTAAEPVPVVPQGTTSVEGLVYALQKGDWEVNIVGMPTVKVESDKTNPVYVRDIDNPTRQPFQQEVELTLNPGKGGENAAIIDIPIGKLFVIEQVSASGYAPAGQKMLFSVMTHIAPDLVTRRHLLQTTNSTFGASNFFMASQSVRIYADTPSAIARAERDFTTGTATARFVVSGYFVDK